MSNVENYGFKCELFLTLERLGMCDVYFTWNTENEEEKWVVTSKKHRR